MHSEKNGSSCCQPHDSGRFRLTYDLAPIPCLKLLRSRTSPSWINDNHESCMGKSTTHRSDVSLMSSIALHMPYIMLWTVSISTNDVHGSNPPSPCEAKNKSWFGCIEAFRMLDSCWTVLSETSRFAQTELDNLDDANEWWDDGDEQGDEDTQPFLSITNTSHLCVGHDKTNVCTHIQSEFKSCVP